MTKTAEENKGNKIWKWIDRSIWLIFLTIVIILWTQGHFNCETIYVPLIEEASPEWMTINLT